MAEQEEKTNNIEKVAEKPAFDSQAMIASLHEKLLELMTEILKLVRDKATPLVELSKPSTGGVDLSTALEQLESATTVKTEDGKKQFLLHRATADHEYAEGAEGNEITLSEPTEWLARWNMAEEDGGTDNPVVSAWIPEDSIKDIPVSADPKNVAITGQKPQQHRFRITVKPGKYKLYQELKQ